MTPLFLQDALMEDMAALLKGFRAGSDTAFHIYGQNLPPRKTDKDYSIYNFVRVLLGDGEDDGEQVSQEVMLVIAVRDTDSNMQGHRDVMNIIQRIRERYRRNPEIADTFVVEPRIQWALPEDTDTYPVFYGAVLLKVQLPQIEIVSELD